MQALQERLEKLENATGSEVWEVLKASEPELRQDLSSLQKLKADKESAAREALTALKTKKNELKNLKNDVESLKNEYKTYIEMVENGLKQSGLDIKQVVQVFERVLEESLSEKRLAILSTIDSAHISDIKSIKTPVKSILKLLEDPNKLQLRILVQSELREFSNSAIEIFRRSLWDLFQNQGIPMKNLGEMPNSEDFLQKIGELFQFSTDLDKLIAGNWGKSIENLISAAFGQLSNYCIDIIENERGEADFEWILKSSHDWAKNLSQILQKTVEKSNLESELKQEFEEKFNEKFVDFIKLITRKFLEKNIKEPTIFSNVAQMLKKFKISSEFNLSGDRDLQEPFYEPKFMSRWILLEVEMYKITCDKLLSSASCFEPLPSIFIGKSSNFWWASEVTVFFDQWISRIDNNINCLENLDAQRAFYEVLYALMIDLCTRIHVEANRLYSESSWSNDVYLVMNTVWELKRLVQISTESWPMPPFEVEKAYEDEWNRLSGMIVEYLNDIVDNMDRCVRSSYASDKQKVIKETFFHVIKCLNNVTIKASKPSTSRLLNVLIEQLFKNLQCRFDKWQGYCSTEVLGCFYTQIYSNLLPQLDELHKTDHWNRENASRSEICRLDALLKMAANSDPSGELVRTAFRSIDEEQVIKMLGELGIHSTSDHAFQDYQILAENWQKIEEKGFGYGDY
ncbi:RAD50-interacting protein 1 [Caenorhabditis elegans]|uniref:RAD50-interacting protein 1 n=1 Tax=Caenorhabditis elegans TaxID=6239 RepID=E1B6W2_CAEEL|nr:RAD50-interacting protein 1 [Caenorhabditis elegans]CBW48582.2 RAD50-interacting protein 1 [Caenorhabditis elegans]